MSHIRTLAAAVVVGTSVWCAAGLLTVATPDSPSVRLAVPASIWWWIVPALVAACVPAWRHRPALAAPALVATLPWWPMPVPVSVLIWTGPMAWVPVGVALLLALRPERARDDATAEPAAATLRGPVLLAGGLSLLLGIATAAAIETRTPGGDEPHYLIITDSLLRDGDLRIENNHEERQYAEYFGGTLAPDFIQRGADGEIYSIHAPGVSVIVLPAFAAFGYRGAQATLLGLAAITGALIWLIGWHATGRTGAAWFAWASVALTPTMLLQSSMVFPDGPGALAAAAAVWLIVRLARRPEAVSNAAVLVVGTALAALPWLHTRFSVLAAGFGLIIAWQLASGAARWRRLFTFLAVPAVAAVAWFGFFWLVYGTVNPAAPYGADSGARLAYIPGGILALLVDQQFGLLAYSPVLIAAVWAAASGGRSELRTVTVSVLALAAVYAAAVTTYWMWWAGVPATPARFLTAVIPAAALPLALAWTSAGPRFRLALGGLLAVSLGISVVTIGVGQGSLAWNTRNAEAQWLEWLGPLANLPRAWPSFFWRLSPDDLSTEWPFVLHAAVFVLVLSAGMLVGLRLARRSGAATPISAVGLAWAFPLSLMLAASAGWYLNATHGLDPARSQLRLAARTGEGRLAWRIEPGRIAADADAALALRIRREEPGRTDQPPPWMALGGVPPGIYRLGFPPPAGGAAVRVTIGRSATPLVEEPGTAGELTVSLPAGASVLVADTAAGADGEVELQPLALTTPVDGLARSFARYGTAVVFFLDDAVYVESAGFWVRGGSSAEFVVVPTDVGAPLSMTVQNGGAPNMVVVQIGRDVESVSLDPSEARDVPIAPAGSASTTRVRVESSAGFRPSDVGPSEDRRFLGAWVVLR